MSVLAGLTPKQLGFVLAYTGTARGNATEAAELAGYNGVPATLASIGAENLRKPAILEAIREIREADPVAATGAEIRKFLSRVMRGELLEPEGFPPPMAVRLRASETLGKMLGCFLERTITVDMGSLSDSQLARLVAGEPLEQVAADS